MTQVTCPASALQAVQLIHIVTVKTNLPDLQAKTSRALEAFTHNAGVKAPSTILKTVKFVEAALKQH
jgi:hypothetical protein